MRRHIGATIALHIKIYRNAGMHSTRIINNSTTERLWKFAMGVTENQRRTKHHHGIKVFVFDTVLAETKGPSINFSSFSIRAYLAGTSLANTA